MSQEYFAVELSNAFYLAIPLTDLVCVTQFELKDICLVPGVASCWYGVVNFKGSLLWVLDGDRLFDTHQLQGSKLTAVVIEHRSEAQRQVALVVRQLHGLIELEPERSHALPNAVPSLLKKSCTSTVERENKNFYLLDSKVFLQQLNQLELVSERSQ